MEPSRHEVIDVSPSAAMVIPVYDNSLDHYHVYRASTLRTAHLSSFGARLPPAHSYGAEHRQSLRLKMFMCLIHMPPMWESPWNMPQKRLVLETTNKAKPSKLILTLIARL